MQKDDIQGDFSEVWTYWDGSTGRRYSFSWGVSRLSCQAKVAEEDLVIEIPKYTINYEREGGAKK